MDGQKHANGESEPAEPRSLQSKTETHTPQAHGISVVSDMELDLVVIGSGPAGQKGAINAAKRGKRVAIVDKGTMLGGVYVHTGTVPSKTFREAIHHFVGLRTRGFLSEYSSHQAQLSVRDIINRVGIVGHWQSQVVRDQLLRNRVTVLDGTARFLDPHHIEVLASPASPNLEGQRQRVLRTKYALIATGTTPVRPAGWADLFDGKVIFDSDQILADRWELPKDFVVVGGGIIGLEYASMLNALPGVRTTIIDGKNELLPFVDSDLVGALMYIMRKSGANFKLGDSVVDISRRYDAVTNRERVHVDLASGRRVHGDNLLYAVGRQGNTATLNLEAAGLKANKRGILQVDAEFRTSVPNIFAAGDIIGFPQLASTSIHQGRQAINNMFNFGRTAMLPGESAGSVADELSSSSPLPYGIYTSPEISLVGATEKQLLADKVPYEVGYAKFEELAKGHMLNAREGFLKLLFSSVAPHTVLGAAAIGEGATEFIHVGQAVIAHGGCVEYFVEAITNSPTFCEAYRIAALDGINRARD